MSSRFLFVLLALGLALGLASCFSNPSSTQLGKVELRLTDAPGDFESINVVVDQVAVHRGDAGGDGDDDSFEGADDDSLGEHQADDDSLGDDADEPGDADGPGAVDDSRAAGGQGWEVVSTETQTFDLLTLQNGTFTSLASASIPAGHYTQIRLRVAAGSNVVVGGVARPLVIPSGMQTGVKLVKGFDVPAGGLTQLTLDFDGARSIVVAGDGTYHLKPTIKVATAP